MSTAVQIITSLVAKGNSPKYLEQLAQNLGRAVRTNNGFNVRVGQVVDGNVQTIATKTLPDGRKIIQKVWHTLEDGGTYAYTRKQKGLSDIFESFVLKDDKGKIMSSTIKNDTTLVNRGVLRDGTPEGVPFIETINNGVHTYIRDGQKLFTDNLSPASASNKIADIVEKARNNYNRFA